MKNTLKQRFWEKVDKSAGTDRCWIWIASTYPDGYGKLGVRKNGRRWTSARANRLAYEFTYGLIPKGKFVCHDCRPNPDNILCVNPKHLWLGTNQENMIDASRKGTIAKGDRNGARLYPERLARGDRSGPRLHPERMARGESNGSAKLTEETVRKIRKEYIPKYGMLKSLAKKYKTSPSNIKWIIMEHNWKHIG